MSAQWSVGYWLRTDDPDSIGLTRWHCEAEQLVFDFMATQPMRGWQWHPSFITADGDYWVGGYPL